MIKTQRIVKGRGIPLYKGYCRLTGSSWQKHQQHCRVLPNEYHQPQAEYKWNLFFFKTPRISKIAWVATLNCHQ
jgi:hypothetical protein